jgi:putative transposase
MKKRFSEEQIVKILQEAEIAKNKREVCRSYNITEQTLYRWKRKYQGMDVAEIKRLKALEEENAKLKKLLAEQMLLNEGLKDVLAKKW